MPEYKKYVLDSFRTFTVEISASGLTTKVYCNDEYFGWFSPGEVENYIMNNAMYSESYITEKD